MLVRASLALALLTTSCCGSEVDARTLEKHIKSSNYPRAICGANVGLDSQPVVTNFSLTRSGDTGHGKATVTIANPAKAAGYFEVGRPCVAEVEFETGKTARTSKKGGIVGFDERIRKVRVMSRNGKPRVEPKMALPPHPKGEDYEGFPGVLEPGAEIQGALSWGDVELQDERRTDDFLVIRADDKPLRIDLVQGQSADHPGALTPLVLEIYKHDTPNYDNPRLLLKGQRNGPVLFALLQGPGSFRVRVVSDSYGLAQGLYTIRMTEP